MFLSLLWKEWREHAWKMLGLTLVLSVVAGGGAALAPERLGPLPAMLIWVAPIWLAAFDVASEHSLGTARLLDALPVGRAALFAARTFFGLLSVMVPMMTALACVTLFHRRDPADARFPTNFVDPFFMTGIYLYLVTLVLTIGARREGLVALVGILVAIAQFLAAVVSVGWLQFDSPHWVSILLPIANLGTSPAPPWVIPAQAGMCLVLISLAAWRFVFSAGLFSPSRSKSSVRPLGAPFAIPAQYLPLPLFWKEWREQNLLIFGTLIGAILVALIVVTVDQYEGGDPRRSTLLFFQALLFISFIAPTILAVALGVGIFAEEVSPRLEDFWRTRPIPPARLVRVKLATAFLGLAFLQATLFAAGGAGLVMLQTFLGDDFLHIERLWMLPAGQFFWLPFVLMLSSLCMVIMRRPIPAAAAAIALTGLLALSLPTLDSIFRMLSLEFPHAYLLGIAACFLLILTLMAATLETAFTKQAPFRLSRVRSRS